MKMTITMKILMILIVGIVVMSLIFVFISRASFEALEEGTESVVNELLEEDIQNKNQTNSEFFKNYGENLARYLALISAPAIWNFEMENVDNFANDLKQLPNIKYVIVYDDSGNIQNGEKPDGITDVVTYTSDVEFEDSYLGQVEIGLDKAYLDSLEAQSVSTKESLISSFTTESAKITNQRVNLMLITTVGVAVALIAVTGIFIYLMTKPIRKVREIVDDLAQGEGDLTVRLNIKSNDEVGRLAASLNQFLDKQTDLVKDIMTISDKIDENSSQLSDIVGDENTLAQEVVEKIAEIESETQNISSSLEEMTASVQEVAANAQTVSRSSKDITDTAESSKDYVVESTQAATQIEVKMEAVTGQMINTADSVEKLVKNLLNIEAILDSINAIAEQTNLLALNAAIEAARAGEAGKGFSVVADEIRKLAEESKGATEQVAKILKDISGQSKEVKEKTESVNDSVKEASTLSVNVREKLGNLLEQIENMVVVSEEGFTLSNQQKESTDEISQAVEASNMSTQTLVEKQQTIVELIRELKTGINTVEDSGKQMKNSAQTLNTQINRFKV
jgi:methyl-accepting chemotaxis protein